MPIPNTTDVGEIMHFLKKDNPSMSRKQKIAIALQKSGKSKKKKKARTMGQKFSSEAVARLNEKLNS